MGLVPVYRPFDDQLLNQFLCRLMTQPLSPGAQAIWDALDMGNLNGPQQRVALAYAVAVLHAAADQVMPSKQTYDEASHEFATVCLHGMSYAANELRAIATELEGIHG